MSKLFKNLVKVTPLVLGASVAAAGGAVAQTMPSTPQLKIDPAAQQQLDRIQRAQNSQQINTGVYQGSMSQVTSVNQLRDVSPTAWAYEALRSLVERYGCIVGYPDRTFKGAQALTRWEFAVGLNACLNSMEKLLQEGIKITQADLETIKKLAQDFQTELATLGTRIDNLEQRTAFIEDHSFSITTKLQGEVIFALSNAWSDDFAVDSNFPNLSPSQQESLRNRPIGNQTTFSDRVRLNLNTSFTGKDLLRMRLQASSIPNLARATGSDMARLSFDAGSLYDNNNIALDDLYYISNIDRVKVWMGARGLDLDDVFDVVNPFLESSATGALSRFNRRNPLVYRGPEGAGLGVRYNFSSQLAVTALYLAEQDTVSNPNSGNGLFNGNYSTGLQFNVKPVPNLHFAVTYLHAYFTQGSVNLSGSTGSPITRDPFNNLGAATRDSVGLQSHWNINDTFSLGGWIGYAKAYAQGIDSSADLWTWQGNFSIRDFVKEGATFTIAGGQLPRVSYVEGFTADRDTSHILEVEYSYPISRYILLTPGFYVIFDPNNFSENGNIWVGVIRTTFRF